MTNTIPRYDWVDALRGYAILLVIMIHTYQAFLAFLSPETISAFSLAPLAVLGDLGVMLFFIASSFTLFNSYSKRSGTERRPKLSFFLRRFFRIAPAYWVAILIYVAISLFIPRLFVDDDPPKMTRVLANALFLNGVYLPGINYLPPGGWSVGVEMLFYLCIPVLYGWIKTMKQSFSFLTFAVLGSMALQLILYFYYSNFSDSSWIHVRSWKYYFWLPNQLPVFGLGILLYKLLESKKGMAVPVHNALILASACIAAALSVIDYRLEFPYFLVQREYLFSIAFFLFAYGLSNTNLDFLKGSFLKTLGKYSFSAYLSHFMIVQLFSFLARTANIQVQNADLHFLLFFSIIVVATFFVSKLSYYTIEKPGINLGERIIDRIQSMPEKSSAVEIA